MSRTGSPLTRPAEAPAALTPLPLSPALPASPALEVVSDDDVRFTRGPRQYRVRGLARCLSAESLKVTLRLLR